MESDTPSADTNDAPSPNRHKSLRPDGWTVTVAMLGSLLLLYATQDVVDVRPSSTGIGGFLSVVGPVFFLAWLAGLHFASAMGRWICIAWAFSTVFLGIAVQLLFHHMEARGFSRTAPTGIFAALLWTYVPPFVLLIIADQSAKRRKAAAMDKPT